MKTYKKTRYQVHTSTDGQNWYAQHTTFPDTTDGLQAARNHMAQLSISTRSVRLARVVSEYTILEEKLNRGVATPEQLAELRQRAEQAVKGIPGLIVSEGFDLDMSTLQHGPSRVSVSFRASDVLGPFPSAQDHKLLKGDTDAYNERKRLRKEYNQRAELSMRAALEAAEAGLKAAGLRYQRFGQAIHLKP